MTLPAIGGIRVSTADQTSGYGPDRQREGIQQEADRNGLELIDWVEETISGADPLYTDRAMPRRSSYLPGAWRSTTEVQRMGKITTTCQRCGSSFETHQFRIDRGQGKFCTVACRAAAASATAQEAHLNVQCASCGTTFTTPVGRIREGRKYCSHACQHAGLLRQVEKTCESCGLPFSTQKNTARTGRGKYCSLACRDKAKRVPAADRFWSKVDRLGPDDCWEWQGLRNANGYGVISSARTGRRAMLAHRAVFELFGTPIPDGLHVMHSCDNPPCVNPAHLSFGTHADNMQDMFGKGRRNAARGMATGQAKLTDPQVLEIRRRKAAGEKSVVLARQYETSPHNIYMIHSRRSWRHLP